MIIGNFLSWITGQGRYEIDLNRLRDSSSELEKRIRELTDANNWFTAAADTMHDVWEGGAADAFVNEIRNDISSANELLETLTVFKEAIDDEISELEDNENLFKKIFNGILGIFGCGVGNGGGR